MENQSAPVVIFTYKRLDTLKNLISSLLKCKAAANTDVYIFSDGPKKSGDTDLVENVREFLKSVEGFKSKELFFSEQNLGLASSVINGVSMVLKIHHKAIVLEDDLVLTPNFLTFMNSALDKYESDKRVFSISGYSFNLKVPGAFTDDAYFLNRGWSWGWATWQDRWQPVDWQVKDYDEFKKDAKLKRAFNNGGSDLSGMLQKQMNNELDSWAIRWFYHQFRVQGLTLYPVYSKVLNAGFDDFATHTTGSVKRYLPAMDERFNEIFNLPGKIEVNENFQRSFLQKMNITSRIKSKISTILLNLFKQKKIEHN